MRDGGETEIGPAVVKARAINVVNDETGRDIFYELAVHKKTGEFSIGFADGALSVEGVLAFCFAHTPIVFCEAVIIGGVNDGEKALCKRNSAKGVAIAQAAIEEDRCDTQPFETGRKF